MDGDNSNGIYILLASFKRSALSNKTRYYQKIE